MQELPGYAEERARKEGIEKQRQGVESLALTRSEKALRGELPIDEGLLKDLATRESGVRDRLFRQMGSDYETSTPGIEALSEFESFRSSALDRARRGDIAQFQPLTGGQRFGYGGPTDALNLQQPFSQAYGSLAGQFGQAQQPYQFDRELGARYSGSQGGGGVGRLFGTVIGGVAGAFAGGVGAAGGAALGSALFS